MPQPKCIIFDSGPLINFAMNGLLPLLEKLKKEFKGEFLITKEVKSEIIDYPETIKRFELESLQLKELFKRGIIKNADLTEEQVNQLRIKRDAIINTANSTFYADRKNIHLIDRGESAALALAKIMNCECVIVIDERTTRMLCENPESLRKIFQKKLHVPIKVNKKNYDFFKGFKIIRSTELAYLAYKKGLFDIKDSKALEATLYGLKYHGCSISDEEIEEMKKM